jgi:hypothetical protein
MSPFYQNERLDSLFTARDPAYHRNLKSQVAQLFSMTNMRNYEPHVDECNEIFIHSMEDLAQDQIDLATWLQWYAFDVIGNITFHRRFGFMEERKDVDGMIAGIDQGLQYIKIVGQFPHLHPYLVGSTLAAVLLFRLFNVPDTMGKFMKVGVISS